MLRGMRPFGSGRGRRATPFGLRTAVLVAAIVTPIGCSTIAGLDQYTLGRDPHDGGDASRVDGASPGDASVDGSADTPDVAVDRYVVDAAAVDAHCDGASDPCGNTCCAVGTCNRDGGCGSCIGPGDPTTCNSDDECCEPNHCNWDHHCVPSCKPSGATCQGDDCCVGYGCQTGGSCGVCLTGALTGCTAADQCCKGCDLTLNTCNP
jgi:hypothetical protein